MGIKVWAFRVGNFVKATDTGWSYTVRFNGLSDLVASLEKYGLRDKIDTLAMVAHGDAGGQVQLDRVLTPAAFPSFASDFGRLNDYFQNGGGKLILVSCIAAVGDAGTDLLVAVSKALPNTHVIAFTVNGVLPVEGMPSVPGMVLDGDGAMAGGVTAKLMKNMPVLTEYSAHSKWARNGAITKLPYQEQVKRPGYKCAWSSCPGHEKPFHRCVPAIKGVSRQRPYPG